MAIKTEYTKAFNDFWHFYPRRIAKAAAFRAWLKNEIDGDMFLMTRINEDIEKRTKLKWWNKDATKIPHPATWINQRRWEDENWEKDIVSEKSGYIYTPYQPIDDGPQISKWARCANGILLKYMRTAGGIPDFKKAVRIKNDVVKETGTAMDEDVASGVTPGECFLLIADLLLDRLDSEFGLTLKNRVLT